MCKDISFHTVAFIVVFKMTNVYFGIMHHEDWNDRCVTLIQRYFYIFVSKIPLIKRKSQVFCFCFHLTTESISGHILSMSIFTYFCWNNYTLSLDAFSLNMSMCHSPSLPHPIPIRWLSFLGRLLLWGFFHFGNFATF